MYTLEWVVDIPAAYGTAPTWHPEEEALYWSDLPAARLYRYTPATGVNEVVLDDGHPVGAIVLQQDGSLLLFRDEANVVAWHDGAIKATVIASIADFRNTRFTAAATAPDGSVYCATQSGPRHPGRLLHLDRSGHLHTLADHFGTPAGMGFNATANHFYFNDAHATRQITWRFDLDHSTGELALQTAFRDGVQHNDPGVPLGLAAAADGSVWLSHWGGSALQQCSTTGKTLRRIELPIKKPTGLTFGGKRYELLYCTSAGGHRRQLEGNHAGALAALRIEESSGFPAPRSQIQLQ